LTEDLLIEVTGWIQLSVGPYCLSMLMHCMGIDLPDPEDEQLEEDERPQQRKRIVVMLMMMILMLMNT
jgi:hypothetical protein